MLLVVQFRDDITEEHEQSCIVSRLEGSKDVKFISFFNEEIDFMDVEKLLEGVDKVILAGNGGLSMGEGHSISDNDYSVVNYILGEIEPLIRYIIKNDFPTLGICFGHQLFGHFLGTKVSFNKERSETGIVDIHLTPEGELDPLFKEIPNPFFSVLGHQDSLDNLPKDCVHLAYSDKCPIHGFRFKKNVYGTQFHAELNTDDLIYRLKMFPEYVEYAHKMEKKSTDNALKVLFNFLEM